MRRKPKNVEDLAQCVHLKPNGEYIIYCVECDAWRHVDLVVIAKEVRLTPWGNHLRQAKIDRDIPIKAVCRICHGEVSYLLDEEKIELLIKRRLRHG